MKFIRVLKGNKKQVNEKYNALRKEVRQIVKEHQVEFDQLAK